jgi:signal peptidase II
LKILFLSLILFLIDQTSKVLVRGFSFPWFNINHNGLYPGTSKPLINNILHLTIVENPGIAFGIDPGESLRDIILIITILTCIGLVAYLIFAKNADKKIRISVALILGGAAGNLFDRIFYGFFYGYAPLFQGNVVDFLDVRFFKLLIFDKILGNYVFNFADISILTGVFIMIYVIAGLSDQKKENDLVPQLIKDKEDAA